MASTETLNQKEQVDAQQPSVESAGTAKILVSDQPRLQRMDDAARRLDGEEALDEEPVDTSYEDRNPNEDREVENGARGRGSERADRVGENKRKEIPNDAVALHKRTSTNKWAHRVGERAQRESLAPASERRNVAGERVRTEDEDLLRHAVAAADAHAAREKDLTAKQIAHEKTHVGMHDDTGKGTRAFLKALQERHPEVLQDKDFRTVVYSQHDEEVRNSGILSEFQNVDIRHADINEVPKYKERPLSSIIYGTDKQNAIRVAKPTNRNGEVVELASRTVVSDHRPIVRTRADGRTPERVLTKSIYYFGTPGDDAAQTDIARNLRGRTVEDPQDPRMFKNDDGEDAPMLSSLRNHDESAQAAMDGWEANGVTMNYSPDAERQIAGVASQSGEHGLTFVPARMRLNKEWLSKDELTHDSGVVPTTALERGTVERAASKAGENTSVFFPESSTRKQATFWSGVLDNHQEAVDKSGNVIEDDLSEHVNDAFKRAMTAQGTATRESILEDAEEKLGTARAMARSPDRGNDIIRRYLHDGTIVNGIKAKYHAFVKSDGITSDPRYLSDLSEGDIREHGISMTKYDGDLARELASIMRRNGQYKSAIEFAEQAIEISPHDDANAYVELARAHIAAENGTEDGDEVIVPDLHEAENNLNEAARISPHNVALHFARAELYRTALESDTPDFYTKQELWNKYANALSDIQRDTSEVSSVLEGDGTQNPALHELCKNDVIDKETGRPAAQEIQELKVTAKLWTEILQARENAINLTEPSEMMPLRLELPQIDANGVPGIAHSEKDVRVQWWQRVKLGEEAIDTAATLFRVLDDVDPEHRERFIGWMEPLMQLTERNFVELPEIMKQGFLLTGETAKLADKFDEEEEKIAKELAERLNFKNLAEQGRELPEGFTFGRVMRDWDGGEPTMPLNIWYRKVVDQHEADLDKPVVLQAEPGGGKTQLAQEMMRKNVQDGVQVWAWDVGQVPQHTDLDEMVGDLAPVTTIKFGDADAALATLALLEPEPGLPLENHIEMLQMIMQAATSAEEPFPQILKMAVQNLYSQFAPSITRSDGSMSETEVPEGEISYPNLNDLTEAVLKATDVYLNEKGESRNQGDIKGFLEVRMRELQSGKLGRHLDSGNAIDIKDLCENHAVIHIDLTGIEKPEDRKLIMFLFYAKRLQYDMVKRKEAGDKDIELSGVDFIEEFMDMFGVAPGQDNKAEQTLAQWFGRLSRQTRRYGRGMVAMIQEADTVLEALPSFIKAANLRIVGPTQSETARDAILSGTGIDKEKEPEKYGKVAELPPGMFMIHRKGSKPMLFKLPFREDVQKFTPQPHRPFKVRGGFNMPDGVQPSPKEIGQAKLALHNAENAWINVYAHTAVQSEILGETLPDIPSDMRQKFERALASAGLDKTTAHGAVASSASLRQFELMRQLAIDRAVSLRGSALRETYNTDKLRATIDYNSRRQLYSSVPLAGQRAGSGLISPHLVTAIESMKLDYPLADNPPSDGWLPVPLPRQHLPHLRKALDEEQKIWDEEHGTVSSRKGLYPAAVVKRAMERLPYSMHAKTDKAASNQGKAYTAWMGSDNLKDYTSSVEKLSVQNPQLDVVWRQIGTEMGLSTSVGDPVPTWVDRAHSAPGRYIRKNVDEQQQQKRQKRAMRVAAIAAEAVTRASVDSEPEQTPRPEPLRERPAAPQPERPQAPEQHAETAEDTVARIRDEATANFMNTYDRIAADDPRGALDVAAQVYILTRRKDPEFLQRTLEHDTAEEAAERANEDYRKTLFVDHLFRLLLNANSVNRGSREAIRRTIESIL